MATPGVCSATEVEQNPLKSLGGGHHCRLAVHDISRYMTILGMAINSRNHDR